MRKWLLLMSLAGCTSPLWAQAEVDVRVGTRLRIRPRFPAGSFGPWRQGTVIQLRGDTIFLQPARGGEPLVATETGTQVSAFGGRRSSLGRGLGIGFAAGAVGGAVLGLAAGSDCGSGDWICFDRGQLAAAGAIFFGGVGALTGLIIGALSSHDVWKPVGQATWSSIAGAAAGRLLLGGSLRF